MLLLCPPLQQMQDRGKVGTLAKVQKSQEAELYLSGDARLEVAFLDFIEIPNFSGLLRAILKNLMEILGVWRTSSFCPVLPICYPQHQCA